MEAHETTELIEHGHEKSKNRTALLISCLAMVLAIASLGGSNAMKEAAHENILAANTYSFYQAKAIRQQALKIATSDLELRLASDPKMPAQIKELFTKKIEEYQKTIARYESEPETKEGKKELLVKAKGHEAIRDHALLQDPWFDYAEGLLQIAIVLLSVSIIGSIPALFLVGGIVGFLGLLSTLNGFLLIIH
jgi:shikimate kinase